MRALMRVRGLERRRQSSSPKEICARLRVPGPRDFKGYVHAADYFVFGSCFKYFHQLSSVRLSISRVKQIISIQLSGIQQQAFLASIEIY